jgi:hypothetical protein
MPVKEAWPRSVSTPKKCLPHTLSLSKHRNQIAVAIRNSNPVLNRGVMRTACSKVCLLVAVAVLVTSGNRALAQSSGSHPATSWLDNAVSNKQCPSTPVNVPAGEGQFSTSALLQRITISGDKLLINGTDQADHIVLSSGGASSLVYVAWNGRRLGRFGPIKEAEVEGAGGDDVLIVKSGVTLPVVLDGGDGDDCVQGGSNGGQLIGGGGDDVLVAGTGRPALNAGAGNDRIVVPQPMGTIFYAPGADSAIVQLLGAIYDLAPLGTSSAGSSQGTSSPIILGAADLGAEQVVSQLQAVRAAGQAVVVTNATQAQSEQLRLMLNHPNAAQGQRGATTGFGAGGVAPLIYYRTAPRPGTKANDYSTGFFLSLSQLDDRTIESLSRIFSSTAIVPHFPGDSASNDLTTLADSYSATAKNKNSAGSSVQVTDTVYDVRSFLNQADFYYVYQEVDYAEGSKLNVTIPLNWQNTAGSQIYSMTPTVIQTTPASTQCTVSTTSGVTWNVGGSVGWNFSQIANATLSGGVSVSNSQTITCPPTAIVNASDPSTGQTHWTYESGDPGHADQISFYNQWIWEVPFSSYQAGQTTISIGSEAQSVYMGFFPPSATITTGITPVVPMPFGDTFALQKPVVTSVNPTCVNAGDSFAINGTGFYPSLVSDILIGGLTYSSSQYKVESDSLISVVAPSQSGDDLPVAVQTGIGQSNTNVGIEISTFNLCQ